MQVLIALQTLFSLLMLYDAIKRGSPYYWWIIVMVPFGEFVYFFAVYMNSPEYRALKDQLFTRPESLKSLEYKARTSPSVHNRILFGRALYDHGRYGEAEALFGEILETDPHNKDALCFLGLCRLKRKDPAGAIAPLEKLVETDMSYEDFSSCIDLAYAYWETGRQDAALALLEKMVDSSQRFSHKIILSKYLLRLERRDDARYLLQEAMNDYEHSPAFMRRTNKKWARDARSMLKSL